MDDPNKTTSHLALVSVGEAAARYGLPEATVRSWIADGRLTALPFGRVEMVDPAAVAALRDATTGGTAQFANRRRWRRAARVIAALDVVAGVTGGAVLLGVGPNGPREPWWLGLCLASVLVGGLIWWVAGRSRPM